MGYKWQIYICYNSIQVHNNLKLYKLGFRNEKLQIPPTTTSNMSLLFAVKKSRAVQRIIIKLDRGLLYETRQYTGIFPKMKLKWGILKWRPARGSLPPFP